MRRGRILILLGLILAIGAAAAVFLLLQRTADTGKTEVPHENVVIADQPIAEDEPVETKLKLASMPADSIPPGTLRSLDETVGMLAAGPIAQGAYIQPEMLISPEEQMREGELGKIVEAGYIAMAFPIDELSSVSYGIQPGDHVDILMSFFFIDVDQETQTEAPLCPPLCPGAEGTQETIEVAGQIPRPVAQLTVQDAEVLGVGRWGYQAAVTEEEAQAQQQQQQRTNQEPAQQTVQLPEYITLMLSPQDALVLKLARELGASIDMAVRSQDDHQVFATQQVTLDYILARFAVTLPAKQPYAVQQIKDLRPTNEGQ